MYMIFFYRNSKILNDSLSLQLDQSKRQSPVPCNKLHNHPYYGHLLEKRGANPWFHYMKNIGNCASHTKYDENTSWTNMIGTVDFNGLQAHHNWTWYQFLWVFFIAQLAYFYLTSNFNSCRINFSFGNHHFAGKK